MPNSVKGEIPLNLSDGRKFVLVADIESIIEAEGLYGKPADKITVDAKAGFVGAIRALFYGMLKRHHPNITPGEVSEMLMNHMGEIEQAMTAASEASSVPAAEGEQSPRPRGGRRGMNSGRSGAKRGLSRTASGDRHPEPSP